MKKTIYDEQYQVLVTILKEYRERSHMTQQELAFLLGSEQSYISKYENGQRRLDFIEVRDICHILGVSLFDVVSDFESEIGRRENKNEQQI